jgi:hypothetical protein
VAVAALAAAAILVESSRALAQAEDAPAAPAPTAAAPAPTPPEPKWYDRFDLSAFVDGYVSVNFGFPHPETPGPSGGGNSFRAYDVSNGFALHWIGLDLSYAADPVGGTLSLRFGPSATIYAGADDAHVLGNVKQAYLTLRPGGDDGAFSLDFGKFDTPYGAEVADSQLNLNYTRGVLYWYAQPLFHTGFRGTLKIADELTVRAILVNGWNDTIDNNAGKTGGVHAMISPAKELTFYVGYLFGPEQPDATTLTCEAGTRIEGGACVPDPEGIGGVATIEDGGANARFKHLVDAVVDINPTSFLRVLVNGDFGAEKMPGSGHVIWYGASIAARVAPIDILGVGLRGEAYRDEDGYTTGLGQATNLYTGTLTVDMSPVKYFTTMLDVRVDGASRPIFQKGIDETSAFQVTTTLGAIVKTE